MNKLGFILAFFLFSSFELVAQNQSAVSDSVKDQLHLILQSDSDNYNANYQLGILYYEEAVRIIRETPFDIDLLSLEKIQDESVELFKKALPFLEKAYRLNPSKKEILSGLSALYLSLNELEKADEIKNTDGSED